jgi:exopolysaccharide biosynthesis polyprenyl glycosylphosphotransferase
MTDNFGPGEPDEPGVQASMVRGRQQRILAAGDAAFILGAFALVIGVLIAFGAASTWALLYAVAAAAIGLLSLRVQRLWNADTIAARRRELTGLLWTSVVMLCGVAGIDRLLGSTMVRGSFAAAAGLTFGLLVLWRSTIVVGTDDRAMELVRIAEVHPEGGMRVVGIIGCRNEAVAAGRNDLWLGDVDDVERLVREVAPDRVVVSDRDVTPPVLNALIRGAHDGGPEVVIHAGLSGIDAARVRVSATSNETLLSVRPSAPSAFSRAVKRGFDIIVAGAVLVIAAPVMAVIAVLIKKEDGGPVFFRQQRVGRGDAEFGMFKFRTMCVDAEDRLAAMHTDNQRSGPLFKMARDPRVTKIGHVLRRTSLDELPQLLNVIKGDMSLVGPRPALRREVHAFPAELHERHAVRPGITGLWQIEARDNPAFDAYQRLDLHYVKNWSLSLDLVVLLATAEQLLMRPFASKHQGEMETVPAAVPPAGAGVNVIAAAA